MLTVPEMAAQTGISAEEFYQAGRVIKALKDTYGYTASRAATALAGTPPDVDGRTRPYRYRLLVFDDMDQLIADTDPDHEGVTLGTMHAYGLTAVAQACAEMVCEIKEAKGRVDRDTIAAAFHARVPTLRVALARTTASYANWRVPFLVDGKRWLARAIVAPDLTRR